MCVCVCVCLCLCVYIYIYLYIYLYICIYIYTHTNKQTTICTHAESADPLRLIYGGRVLRDHESLEEITAQSIDRTNVSMHVLLNKPGQTDSVTSTPAKATTAPVSAPATSDKGAASAGAARSTRDGVPVSPGATSPYKFATGSPNMPGFASPFTPSELETVCGVRACVVWCLHQQNANMHVRVCVYVCMGFPARSCPLVSFRSVCIHRQNVSMRKRVYASSTQDSYYADTTLFFGSFRKIVGSCRLHAYTDSPHIPTTHRTTSQKLTHTLA